MTGRKTPKAPKAGARKPSGVAALAAAQKARDAADADADLDAFVKSNACDAPDDAAAFDPGAPGPPDAHALASAVARAALDAALPARLRARLAAGDPVALVVSVPDRSWVAPVEDGLRRLAPAVSVVARDGSSRSQHKPQHGGAEVAYALADGRPVVGVAPLPDAFLPAPLVSSADARIALAPPSGTALRRLLRRFARGPVPRGLRTPCASLTFDEILSAFRAGATARAVLANFGRTVATKAGANAPTPVPPLHALPGFSGEARAWGENLVECFSRWRSGDVPWSAISASASCVIAGPPGTGKTLFARSLARSLNVPIVETSVGAWISGDGDLGAVVRALQESWNSARASAPSLWFLDELDGLPSRDSLSARAREWWSPLVGLALTLLSSDHPGTAVCAATNFADRCDAALVRPGRLERIINVPLPSVDDLSAVASFHASGALSAADLLPAVRLAVGASAADAARWASLAQAAARADGRGVTVDDFVAVVAPPDPRSPADVRRAAVHEAGHALALVAAGPPIDFVTLVASGRSGGMTRPGREVTVFPTARDLDAAVVVTLSGRAAEEAFFDLPSSGAESDLASATDLVCAQHASNGVAGALVHRAASADAASLLSTDPVLRRTVGRHVARLYAEAQTLVRRRRAAVERIADALVERRLLNGDEVVRLVGGHAAPGGSP